MRKPTVKIWSGRKVLAEVAVNSEKVTYAHRGKAAKVTGVTVHVGGWRYAVQGTSCEIRDGETLSVLGMPKMERDVGLPKFPRSEPRPKWWRRFS